MSFFCHRCSAWLATLCLATGAFAAAPPKMQEKEDPNKPISFFKQIRPVFQANCQGCHQPAKAKGGYVMTDFNKLIEGGEEAQKEGKKAVVPGKPEQSHLITLITPHDGEAEMPVKKPPLSDPDRELVRRWIAEGAKNDTPENARQRFDAAHPPTYTRPPLITSLAYSPDGTTLAIAGFHEVLLWHADGSAMLGRLVGLSERVQSVRFSPDGMLLAVAAGRPAQLGEIQIWDVAKRKLQLSFAYGFDTLYGVSWNPAGTHVAFGCPDNSVRALDVKTGQLSLMMNLHSDWPIDTAWSLKGDHLISVSRDMSVKLTEVETQRFVDNVTSITPGALRGGLNAIARNPVQEEIMIGGSDGVPQTYQIFRTKARKIGDNSNLRLKFPQMNGRIFAVGYSADGKRCAAGSSLDGQGEVAVFEAVPTAQPPDDIQKLMLVPSTTQTDADKKKIADYYATSAKVLYRVPFESGIYSLSWRPDGSTIAVAGEDGHVRLLSSADGSVTKDFIPVPMNGASFAENEAASKP
jgi:WD40 repeat protein